jgi:hypothetical protein
MKTCIFSDITQSSPLKANPMFWWKILPPSSGLKNKPRQQRESPTNHWFPAGFWLYSSLDSEDGGNVFLRNGCWFLTDYTALYPRKYNTSECATLYDRRFNMPEMTSEVSLPTTKNIILFPSLNNGWWNSFDCIHARSNFSETFLGLFRQLHTAAPLILIEA